MTDRYNFDIRQTNIAKGIAIMLLLWRHLFELNPNQYSSVDSIFYIFSRPVECLLDNFALVCVSIFLFLSGFGLYKSYKSSLNKRIVADNNFKQIKFDFKFVKKHIVKLLMVYIVVFLLSYIWFCIRDNKLLLDVYQGNVFYLVLNLFGLSNIFRTPTIFGTFWYIGLIIVLYIIFPIMMRIEKYSIELLLCISFLFLVCPPPGKFGF